MITNKELNEVALSTTKKDYYQIWNELIELADKISERWSPASTNESDPGIVLLKVLTAVADKLNYNIDKNTLEAFMPSATQEDSMRKLTEMMGYSMQHYRSATGKVTITYKSSNETPITDFKQGIYFPKFINLKNEDEDINYVTLEEFTLQPGQDSREISIIEGEVIECETNTDNLITAIHLDDLNRYFLPEYVIAENGIFITNIKDSEESALWRKEQNLNVQQPGTKVYKVGFNSAQRLPYVQFPADIKTLLEDGIRIKYIRTNGLSGNISAKVLSKMEKPALWSTAGEDSLITKLAADNFAVTNASACNNGADPESLNAAYNNYKKTIGTFDTLVTCRDYMNKIYQMTVSDIDTTPLVSNIIVSDIRDDINRSTPVCTFNEYGICYKDASLKESIVIPVTLTNGTPATYTTTQDKIEHFDLVFYPFKTVYGLNNKTEYKNSFNYTSENLEEIRSDLALNKNIAHNIITPLSTDIVSIKNYLKLKAKVTTTKKVTLIEESEILNNIYKAIYANFNARQIELGEEIPYETIVSVLKNADYRIKEISLDEPSLSTKFRLRTSSEEELSTNDDSTPEANELYNSLVRRNVLAGRISAFQYDNAFIPEYDKIPYPYDGYASVYPSNTTSSITKIESHFDVGEAFDAERAAKAAEGSNFEGYTLKENEVIQFRVPNFKTTKTYPAYVNYFIKLNTDGSGEGAIPATFETLGNFLRDKWGDLVNEEGLKENVTSIDVASPDDFNKLKAEHGALFTNTGPVDNAVYSVASNYIAGQEYYYLPIKPLDGQQSIFWALNRWIKNIEYEGASAPYDNIYTQLNGIYRTVGVQEKPFGRLIDEAQYKYLPAYNFGTIANDKAALNNFYIQVTHAESSDEIDNKEATVDGLGQDADYEGVPKDGEYCLKTGEYLLINYTDSKTDESGTEQKTVVNKVYTEGDIIRANFMLIDSALYHTNHSYSKRDGFTFAGQQPEGMFTLGTNEQIEIRDIVKVELNEDSTYLYWSLNSDDPAKSSNTFIFDEDYDGGTDNAYTLKEGEHLYYTNSKKQDLVYYGSGTLIVKNNPGLKLVKYARDGEVSEEEIMTNGLAAAIPWVPCSLSKNNQLTIIENQYISLTEGDMIISIDGTVPRFAETMPDGSWNNWVQLTNGNAEYRLAEDEANSHLPAIVVNGINWTVRSRLDFNMSRELAQPLHRGDSLKISFDPAGVTPVTLTPQGSSDYETVYVNSNYTCQAAIDTIDFSSLSESDEGFKVKISKQEAPTKADTDELLLLNNYINGDAKYTKFDFANLPSDFNATGTIPAFTLNINIPGVDGVDNPVLPYGLIALYYIRDDSTAESHTPARIEVVSKAGSESSGIRLFNKNHLYGNSKELEEGFNIIQVHPNVTTLKFYADTALKDIVVFGSLDIVTGINPKLDYRIITKSGDTARLDQLLDDLQKSGVADDFYYNVPIQRATEIDLNPNIEEDLLSSPLAWYDPNNVNRKFVISEIDADYLSTGITLTKGSRA